MATKHWREPNPPMQCAYIQVSYCPITLVYKCPSALVPLSPSALVPKNIRRMRWTGTFCCQQLSQKLFAHATMSSKTINKPSFVHEIVSCENRRRRCGAFFASTVTHFFASNLTKCEKNWKRSVVTTDWNVVISFKTENWQFHCFFHFLQKKFKIDACF